VKASHGGVHPKMKLQFEIAS